MSVVTFTVEDKREFLQIADYYLLRSRQSKFEVILAGNEDISSQMGHYLLFYVELLYVGR